MEVILENLPERFIILMRREEIGELGVLMRLTACAEQNQKISPSGELSSDQAQSEKMINKSEKCKQI